MIAVMFAARWAAEWATFGIPQLGPFVDAITYLGAGERLNDGHALYALQPGDRELFMVAGSDIPLFSPPPIAAPWRLLAHWPIGFAVWVVASWVALLGTQFYLVARIGLPAAVVCLGLSNAVGQQLLVANMASFFPMLMVLMWRFRRRPMVGLLLGAMTALKISPGVLTGWVLGRRDKAMLAWAVGGGLSWLLAGAAAAGIGSYVEYVEVAMTLPTSEMSLASVTGVSWASIGLLVAGTLVAAALGRRRSGLAFSLAVGASILGQPALFMASLGPAIAVLAPLLPDPTGDGEVAAAS